jgi:hypothetical protein
MTTASKASKLPLAIASGLLGCALSLSTVPVLAGGGGALLGGLFAGSLLTSMADNNEAEEERAYARPRTVVVHDRAPSHSSAGSAESRIKQLDKLRAGGYITEAEYKQKKKAIVDSM